MLPHANTLGRASVKRLCRCKPGDTQRSDDHPGFSLDDRWVIFNSRIGNRENIYMADVQSVG